MLLLFILLLLLLLLLGSVRIPSSLMGLYGLKTTSGRVDSVGLFLFLSQLYFLSLNSIFSLSTIYSFHQKKKKSLNYIGEVPICPKNGVAGPLTAHFLDNALVYSVIAQVIFIKNHTFFFFFFFFFFPKKTNIFLISPPPPPPEIPSFYSFPNPPPLPFFSLLSPLWFKNGCFLGLVFGL